MLVVIRNSAFFLLSIFISPISAVVFSSACALKELSKDINFRNHTPIQCNRIEHFMLSLGSILSDKMWDSYLFAFIIYFKNFQRSEHKKLCDKDIKTGKVLLQEFFNVSTLDNQTQTSKMSNWSIIKVSKLKFNGPILGSVVLTQTDICVGYNSIEKRILRVQ